VLVVEAPIESEGKYLGFETLTFVPLDRTLVDKNLLTEAEIGWWNRYHEQVEAILGPQMDGDDRAWLKDQCTPL